MQVDFAVFDVAADGRPSGFATAAWHAPASANSIRNMKHASFGVLDNFRAVKRTILVHPCACLHTPIGVFCQNHWLAEHHARWQSFAVTLFAVQPAQHTLCLPLGL
jgi:hypothetical protein